MLRRSGRAVVVAGLALPLAGLALPAEAQTPPAVSLEASRTVLTYGEGTTLSGTVWPPVPGETVAIVDEGGTVLAAAAPGFDGRYEVSLTPQRNVRVHAEWQGAVSDDLQLKVRPVLEVRLSGVLLFGRATVRGTVDPPEAGARVTVTLLQGGRAVGEQAAVVSARGSFRARFPVRLPGTYRAMGRFEDPDFLAASARSGGARTPLPTLAAGSRGLEVRLLEARLRELRYHLTGVDTVYDDRTADAVLAFRKVQGMERTQVVDPATWRALADPKRPRPRMEGPGFHIEVDQTRQVLYTVDDGEVTNIVHVSTGRNGYTRDGLFTVYRKLAGYSPNRLYYPSYFDGLRAVHGWPDVPTYPASHGCVRIPMWAAVWMFGLVDTGTRILIHH